jgi:KUP system potassium uptake protein
MAPEWAITPLAVLATAATVIASQALISGAFSLTQQAVQLGYTPRVNIVHTSVEQAGQIYIPEVNKALAVGTLLLVVSFGSSTALGAAYGVAVTGTMAITSVLFYVVTRSHWGWPRAKALAFLAFFLTIDLAFFAANLLKVPHGGWVPLSIAALVFILMTTWKKGRTMLNDALGRSTLPLNLLLEDIARRKTTRVPGTAVFLTSVSDGVPVVLMHHLKHNKVLHEQVILLSVQTAEVPEVDEEELLVVEELGQGFFRVVATYGFMETPNVPEILEFCRARGLSTKLHDTSFYLGRERLLPIGKSPMWRWRKKLFALMSRNARSATEFFGLPPNRVVELGAQIEF